jgi:GT2 family glycosyltransferase
MYDPTRLDDAGDYYCALGWAFARGKGESSELYDREETVFACCGAAAIYRRDVLEKIGLFDERHFAYLEDMDIGYRAQIHGYVNRYIPSAVVYHAGSGTSGSRHNAFKVRLSARNSVWLVRKNMPLWQRIVMTHNMSHCLTNPDFIAYQFEHRHHTLGNYFSRKVWGILGVSWTIRTKKDYDLAVKEGWIPIFENFIP